MTGPLLTAAAAGLAAGVLTGRRTPRLWLALTVASAASALGAALLVLATGSPWEWHSAFLLGGEPVHLRLDGLSAFFLTLTSLGGGAGAVYSHEYWNDRAHPDSAPSGRMWWSAFLLSMGLVLLVSNGLHFLIAWELFALTGYFLLTLDRRRAARQAGWLYLCVSHAGTLCLFAFFALLAARTGSWDLGPVRDHPELAPLFWLALAGFGVKAGLFPLHVWLPSAHANAPSHVSAIMSGVAIKMGIYGILRFSGWLPVAPDAGWVVLSLGAITAVLGIAFALAQDDVKRLLAYSSVENMGIVLIGLGGGLLGVTHAGAAWGRLALAGALLHLWNHALFKSLMFYGAGSVLHGTGTRDMSRLGGLWRAMPWTAALFAIGAIAVSALPPLNGFVSEWLVYLGLFGAVTSHTTAAWAATPAVVLLGITGALALATFTKAAATIFLGAPRTGVAKHAHECGGWMRAPMLLAAAGCAIIGLAPLAIWPAVARAAEAWQPGWTVRPAPAALRAFAPLPVALAAVVAVAVLLLVVRVRRGGARRNLTWDCGYAVPTARMQYTSGSFAAIPAGWFGWILRPERVQRRPRGVFPAGAWRLERVPETVLERVIQPAGGLILRVSAAARRLQHGRLQFYLAYVVVGLLGLAALAAWGAKP